MVGCVFGVLWMSASASAQCADGTVEEHLVDGTVAGCAGAWNEPGLVDSAGNVAEPGCDRRSGNDGDLRTAEAMLEEGATCTPADLCAPGWALCTNSDAIPGASCDETTVAESTLYVAATASCGDFGEAGHVVGCGSTGCGAAFDMGACSVFNRRSYGDGANPCDVLNRTGCPDGDRVASGWSCFDEGGGGVPASNVVKATSSGGGVLCCFREVCDCTDDSGECYADGELAAPCLVCEASTDPGVTVGLSVIAGCGEDAGIPTDAGSGAIDAGSGPEPDLGNGAPADFGPGPNDTDLGAEQPGITFRGDGGCECRAAGDGAPAFGLIGLALFALRRRR